MRNNTEPLVQLEELVGQLHELLRTSDAERPVLRMLLRQAEALRVSIERESHPLPPLVARSGRHDLHGSAP
jgi:hypothetical protein